MGAARPPNEGAALAGKTIPPRLAWAAMTSVPALLRASLTVLLLVSVAGCIRKADDAVDAQPQAPDGAAAGASHMAAAMSGTPAPTWAIGQSWTHKWTIVGSGGDDNFTFLVRTVVAEKADGGWTLATDNQTIAAFHGAFIIPTLGRVSHDLVQAAGETRFPWYHFPLKPNATWTDTVVGWDGAKASTLAVTGRVTAVTHSPAHTYHVEMAASDHVVAEYDYDVETEWFREARFYDDSGTLQFLVQMVETGTGFTGRLYDNSAGKMLLSHQDFIVPAEGVVQPAAPQEFTMAAGQNRLLVFLFSFAFGGAHDSELIAPDGTRHGAQSFDGVLAPFYNDSRILLLPGQAGTWHAASAGAGAFAAGGFIQTFGMHERVIEL